MKFFVPVLSALLAGANAEAEAKSWLGYGGYGLGYGSYSYAAPLYGSYGGYGIWKRDAEAKPEADAEAWYGTYGYSGLGGLGYGTGYGTGYATGYSAATPAVLAAPALVARPAIAVTRTAIPVTQTTHVPVTHTRTETVPVGVQTRVVSGGIVNGAAGIWKREADAEPEAEAWGTYGYSGLGGLGYGGAYGTGYATGYAAAPTVIAAAPAVIARPAVAVTHTAIPVTQTTHVPVAHTRSETVAVGVQRRVVSGGIVNGAAGIWKRDADSDAEAYYGNFGYGLGAGLGYTGAYTTGLTSIAAPVYGYSTPAYTTSYAGYGYGKRSADAESDAEAYYGNYGYGLGAGLGYTGAYTTGLTSIAAPVYGYSTPAYTTGYAGYGYGKRSADAESDPQAWYGNYGYSTGLGYGGYTTATIARPVYGYANLGYSGYGAGYGLY